MGFFHIRKIDNVLSAGGLPDSTTHIEELKKEGFSTIVSLEPLQPGLINFARSQGLKHVNLHVGWGKEVPFEKLKRFLSIVALAEAKGEKIFLHCLQGKDRSGEVIAAYMLAKKAFDRSRELGLEGPLRLIRYRDEVQAHFERTLARAKKYKPKIR